MKDFLTRYLRIVNHFGEWLMYGEIKYLYEVEHYFYMKGFKK